MRLLPSLAEPDLTHLLLSASERKALRKVKGTKGIAAELRRMLK